MNSSDPSTDEIDKMGVVSKWKTLFETRNTITNTENVGNTQNSIIDTQNTDVAEITHKTVDVVSNGYVAERQEEKLLVDQIQAYDKSLLDEISQLNLKIEKLEALLAEKNRETSITLEEFAMYKIKIMKTLAEFGNVVEDLTQENREVKKALAEKMLQSV